MHLRVCGVNSGGRWRGRIGPGDEAGSAESERMETAFGASRLGNDSASGSDLAPLGVDLQAGVVSDPLSREQ